MFGLREHVGRDHDRGGPGIGNDQNFAGPGQHVYAHLAHELAFGLGDISVAGAGDDIHGSYGFRAQGQGGDGGRAAHRVNFFDADKAGRGQDVRVEAAILIGRRNHGDFRYPGHQGGQGGHKQTGDERGFAALAAGHVKPGPGYRPHRLA